MWQLLQLWQEPLPAAAPDGEAVRETSFLLKRERSRTRRRSMRKRGLREMKLVWVTKHS